MVQWSERGAEGSPAEGAVGVADKPAKPDFPKAEHARLNGGDRALSRWRHWGPYVSDRAWGTVREDYSANGDAWSYLTHDQARSKAYRWGEDGLAAVCDRYQALVFSLALWNGRGPILKERLFGVTPADGNHGEDVKECYFYLDNLPSHAYIRFLYKYSQAAFPYAQLVEENRRRNDSGPAFVYEPAESPAKIKSGNSNWRGPIWFPTAFLLIEALRKLGTAYGRELTVPVAGGQERTFWDLAEDLAQRMIGIFLRGEDGRRPVYGDRALLQQDPHWRDLLLFYEYFHGDTGEGLGASHQTGWTALVASLIDEWRRGYGPGETSQISPRR